MRRLRPAYTADELAALYRTPHDAARFPDHVERVALSIAMIRLELGIQESAADLSCGNGAIIDGIDVRGARYKGDLAPGYPITGPLEQTLHELPERVGLFICSETLEHVDDPPAVLAGIRARADRLFLSTPWNERDDSNPEHYWSWGSDDLAAMLYATGWRDLRLRLAPLGYYTFQLWVAS